MGKTVVLTGGYHKGNQGNLQEAFQYDAIIQSKKASVTELVIDPLRAGWDTPLQKYHYRSGCAPLMALDTATQLIEQGEAEVVIIKGKDFLRTGYDREERQKLMAVYGEEFPVPEAYTELAATFMEQQGISTKKFRHLAALIFENYCITAKANGMKSLPHSRWFQDVTRLFRGVDCANPVVDFEGRLVLCSEEFAHSCGLTAEKQISVLGVAVEEIEDGLNNLLEIAKYEHLRKAYQKACEQSNLDFKQLFLDNQALMEVYTCYPVVPLGFLQACGFVSNTQDWEPFLAHYEITLTGGMNLERAAWNNPSLAALINMFVQLQGAKRQYGLVHGNGGLGYRQGIAILGRKAY